MAVDVLPAPSVAVHVTIVVPAGNTEGASLITVVPEQLSLYVALPKFKLSFEVPHCPASVLTTRFAGAVISGFSASVTVTLKVAESHVPEVSLTVVVPSGKKEPGAGTAVTVPQVVVDEILKVTIAPHCPGSFETVRSEGGVILQN